MNPHHHTTRLRGAEQTTQATHTNAQTGALEFISPEAAIRHDCEQSPVPD